MGNTFRLSPEDSVREGKKQIAQAGQMRHLTTELFTQIDELLKTGYTSPGARAMYAKIVAKKPVLDGLAKTYANYGSYMVSSGGRTIQTDESIADGVKTD